MGKKSKKGKTRAGRGGHNKAGQGKAQTVAKKASDVVEQAVATPVTVPKDLSPALQAVIDKAPVLADKENAVNEVLGVIAANGSAAAAEVTEVAVEANGHNETETPAPVTETPAPVMESPPQVTKPTAPTPPPTPALVNEAVAEVITETKDPVWDSKLRDVTEDTGQSSVLDVTMDESMLAEEAKDEAKEIVAEVKAAAVEAPPKLDTRSLPSMTEPAPEEKAKGKDDCACVIL